MTRLSLKLLQAGLKFIFICALLRALQLYKAFLL